MIDDKTRDSLEKLQLEINNTKHQGTESSDKLEIIQEKIDKVLELGENTKKDHIHELIDYMVDSTELFEVSHPELTGIMNSVIQSLNALGI